MDWTKQAEEVFKTWTSTQQKMVESWTETVKIMANPQAPDAWAKTVETWQGAFKKALESQVELTRLWSESVTAGVGSAGAPKEITAWTTQMVDMTKTWTETQARFSDSLFDMLKKSDPTTVAPVFNNEQSKKLIGTFQEATQKAMDAQLEWVRSVLGSTK